MELVFKGKRSAEEIIKEANSFGSIDEEIMGGSVFLLGDNYKIMSQLYNKYGAFVDLVYIDPPFNTNQTFSISSSGRANSISKAKNSLTAYSDLMSEDEYLNFMYERFVLIYNLLSPKGSLYVHIDTKMGHYFKVMLDEIFGEKNFKNDITRIKSNPKNFDRKAYGNEKDMILFYSKDSSCNIWNEVKIQLTDVEIEQKFEKIESDGRRYTTIPLHAPGECNGITGQPWRGMYPPEGRHWRTSPAEFDKLEAAGCIEWSKNGNPRIKKYADEHKGKKIQDIWTFKDPQKPLYPTQKNQDMLELIIKQSSSKGGYVMDCFAGSGTTLSAAKKLDRKFIGIDSSNLALEVAKKRLNLSDEEILIK